MKHVFYVDVRHLPYQTFMNISFYLVLYNILVFKQKCVRHTKMLYIFHQIRVKCVEYDFQMQRFIILNQFYNSPKIADFLKIFNFLSKMLKPFRIQNWFFVFYKSLNKVTILALKQSKY